MPKRAPCTKLVFILKPAVRHLWVFKCDIMMALVCLLKIYVFINSREDGRRGIEIETSTLRA